MPITLSLLIGKLLRTLPFPTDPPPVISTGINLGFLSQDIQMPLVGFLILDPFGLQGFIWKILQKQLFLDLGLLTW